MSASPGQLASSSAVSACNSLAGLAPDRFPAWLFGTAERLCGAFETMADALVDQLQRCGVTHGTHGAERQVNTFAVGKERMSGIGQAMLLFC